MLKRTLPGAVAAVAACSVLGSLASQEVGGLWYRTLTKPAIQPPKQVFPIVWTSLYTDIAVTSGIALDRLGRQSPAAARAYGQALGLNLVLNAGWSWVFFNQRRLGPAAVAAAALTVSSADLARRAAAVNAPTGAVLALYPLWCGFATLLSTRIWQLNR